MGHIEIKSSKAGYDMELWGDIQIKDVLFPAIATLFN